MKLLNIDELITVEKSIRFKGVDHSVIERSIGQVIKAVKFSRTHESMEMDDQMESAVALIIEAVPTMSVEDLNQVPMAHLNAIISFIQQSDLDEAEEPEGKLVEEDNSGKK
jgi:hypothetical protein